MGEGENRESFPEEKGEAVSSDLSEEDISDVNDDEWNENAERYVFFFGETIFRRKL